MRASLSDLSLSAATAGFVAVLVGFTSSVAIVFQAATALGATPAQISSWMWALGVGMGLCSLLPSLWLRQPVVVVGRRFWPRFAVPGVLIVGTLYAALNGQLHLGEVQWTLTAPVFVAPEFSLSAIVSLALPLFIVTMASQNLPGVAAIRAAGYQMPVSKIVTLTGVATLLLAPFGAFALNLAAITAAICMSREAHEDPDRRYMAAASCGALYCAIGLFGAA